MTHCQTCGSKKDVQFILVRNSHKPQKEYHKEWHCPTHLRLRCAELEFHLLVDYFKKQRMDKTRKPIRNG